MSGEYSSGSQGNTYPGPFRPQDQCGLWHEACVFHCNKLVLMKRPKLRVGEATAGTPVEVPKDSFPQVALPLPGFTGLPLHDFFKNASHRLVAPLLHLDRGRCCPCFSC
eukprot:1159411-Pelagomonas_calceolata.AAC.2